MNAIKSWLTCLLRRDDIYVVVVNKIDGDSEALIATFDETEAIEFMLSMSSINTDQSYLINKVKLV
tara:strand:+ start:1287 stop:1484 length:198 start_codon:yes stop_codon:yes gene_type:complete